MLLGNRARLAPKARYLHALIQRKLHVPDRIPQQCGHPVAGLFRFLGSNRLQHRPVLVQAIASRRFYPPAQAKRTEQRRIDQPAKSADKQIAGGVENRLMKAQIRSQDLLAFRDARLHLIVGGGDRLQGRHIARLRRQESRLRLDHLPQLEEIVDEILAQRRPQMPR